MTNTIQKIKQLNDKIYIIFTNTVKILTKDIFSKQFPNNTELNNRLFDNWTKVKLDKDMQMLRFGDINIDVFTIDKIARDITIDEYLELLKHTRLKRSFIERTISFLL